ncbi:uncharacterized protein SOCEGT47_068560 [Sorangium cellulosum]|uniref:Secreted protein n=1 Tax=Sorangium cellulosum TaxID=56 RepID=A0A4P2Q9M5_SORCE|nr:Ig-like domain-containing protein [Sorangium cellulosum]AUX26295.1 uncharacterized protein SOCEGT47_068560 [Sorangium cellulosum]
MNSILLRRGVPVFVAGAAALSTLTWTTGSAACGATAPEITALSPRDGAVDVPLNAALFAGSNLGRLDVTLREAQSGDVVPLAVSCNGFYDNTLCVAHAGPLAENTTYEWTAALVDETGLDGGAPEWHQFTTGTALDERTPLASDLSVSVLARGDRNPGGCTDEGPWTSVRISFSVDEPVLFDLAGLQRIPVPVPEGRSEHEIKVPSDSFCFTPRVLDVAGNEWFLQPVCVSEDDSPAQPDDPAHPDGPAQPDDPAQPDETEPAEEDTAATEPGATVRCSVGQTGGNRELGAASLLSAAAALALVFRSRRPRSPNRRSRRSSAADA